MIDVRSFESLGHADHGWLNARHHFSFADYFDPERTRFGALRVWNDDLIAAQTGFDMHPHRDMEIITYLRQGAVSHQDSLGNRGRTRQGEVQVMSAGTGIVHAEHNREDGPLRLFQIWIEPDRAGHQPRWETRSFDTPAREGRFEVLVSGRGGEAHDGALFIHQDAALSATVLNKGEQAVYPLEKGRKAYVVPARGVIEVNGVALSERSGAAIDEEDGIVVKAREDSEVVLVDVP
ncbi:pirin family protein [Varunaivibrio sulfuroxidans]|uniref:Pirin N-terminal domain-containing protein n=1 Tax=Varunaivibrio sulfuroxidans TaxID=1773489 RepID=A0A4V2UNM7_9PROT|nr:pirin family protein [Varunaivibrio sulfuroxidans]TCS62671.1 hypothetical protein EDD55_105220 [Varunaivibrio sulfuroxidans]WES30665.1 pirin family protein [Varunaivibrio sulfuroxidans]